MTALAHNTKRPLPVALALGLLGGLALLITTALTSNGPAIFIPYAALIIATFATLRIVNWPSFYQRFKTSFLTFMVATIILYIFMGFIDTGTIPLLTISVWGHVWRLGSMAVIGGILSLAVAYLADIGHRQEA